MILIAIAVGLLMGLDIGYSINCNKEKDLRLKAEADALSGYEHEAYLRKRIEELETANQFLRSAYERRKLQ